jgi:hypothetical protein
MSRFSATIDTTVIELALRMALTQHKPITGLFHHSDRGCLPTSEAYQSFLMHLRQVAVVLEHHHLWCRLAALCKGKGLLTNIFEMGRTRN